MADTISKSARKKKNNNVAASLYGLRPAVVVAVVDAVRQGHAERVRHLIRPLHYCDVADLLERLPSDLRNQVVDYCR
ncbi:MAG: hypothetical protein OXC54_05305, partial [Rhodospirillaceae bacterium]|nr:hypothetical protein [Rhodospirillaceae bacterium]